MEAFSKRRSLGSGGVSKEGIGKLQHSGNLQRLITPFLGQANRNRRAQSYPCNSYRPGIRANSTSAVKPEIRKYR